MEKPLKSLINFEALQAVDIRVGRIVAAVPVPKTKKLLQLQVDFGPELGTRQVIAAIAEHFSPENLLDGYGGTYHPFVVNLEPREIRGLQSEAMIVLAEKGASLFKLNTPPIPGAIIL